MILVMRILLLVIIAIKEHICQECVLSLHRDLPKRCEPLYYIQNGNSLELMMPHMVGEDGVLTLYEGQQIVLACPGRNNRLTVTGTEATLTKCAGGIMLNIEDRQFPTYQLECENPVQAIVKITSEKCGCDHGNEIRIGFQSPNESILNEFSFFSLWRVAAYLWRLIYPKKANESSHWVNLLTTCHNLKKSETIYSSHIVYGKTLAGAEMKMTRPQFIQGNDNLYPGFNPDYFYKRQLTVFQKLVGKRNAAKYLQNNFLSRGHLSPDADFLFGSWQYTTYFYANTAPQWLSINAGNWQRMERYIRQYAITTGSNLLVVTGTHDTLTLPDHRKKQKTIYLHPDEKRIPVPKYFWKILVDPEKKACVAFVCTNNPFLKKKPMKLCTDICRISGWPPYTEMLMRGYIYCCDAQQLRKKITNIPPIDCVSLLVGPKAFYNYKPKE